MGRKCKNLSRRKFIKLTGASTIGAMVIACDSKDGEPSEQKIFEDAGPDTDSGSKFDVILKGGSVYLDGVFSPADSGVSNGTIVSIDPTLSLSGDSNTDMLDCTDKYVTPGWVDFHVHIGNLGVELDKLGAPMGVTALLDAGTWGGKNFDQFLSDYYNKNPNQIDIFTMANLREDGITLKNNFIPHDEQYNDVEGATRILANYPNIVKGLKCRTDESLMNEDDPLLMVKATSTLGAELNVPVMYHFNTPPPTVLDLLDYTKPGDIITHCLRPMDNGILAQDETVLPEVLAEKANGLLFDVGHGRSSFSFKTAIAAIEQGFIDFTISSDIHTMSLSQKAKTFANVLSKFLICGMTLEQVIERCTTVPRKWLDLEWQIAAEKSLDLTVFSIAAGDFTYTDCIDEERTASERIIPEYTIVKGKVFRAGDRDREVFLD